MERAAPARRGVHDNRQRAARPARRSVESDDTVSCRLRDTLETALRCVEAHCQSSLFARMAVVALQPSPQSLMRTLRLLIPGLATLVALSARNARAQQG